MFASGEHIPVRIDGNVEGVVSGRFDMPPERFLDMIGQSYGFVWYYDGAVLQVSPANAQTRLVMRPNFLGAKALSEALERAHVSDAHFPLKVDEAARTIDVFGPATYVARVREAAQRFEDDARKRVRTTVRVFRLGVANAADESRVIHGRTVTVPGAATLLRRRFERRAAVGASEPAADAPQVVEFDAPLPTIEADASTNSILIRDKPERIDADGVMVADLDVRPTLVSVQAWVVDVDADALAGLQSDLPAKLAALAEGRAQSSVDVTTDEAGRTLLASLGELEKTERAHVQVSRTVLALDQSSAVIDEHDARLAQPDEEVESDVWLSIRPTVEGAATMPHLSLHVELGHSDDARRDRSFDERVEAGDCLVIAMPTGLSDDTHARQRLVLLIPRIAA